MFFSRSLLLSLVATPLLALAQSNPFNIPEGDYNATAGQSLDLSWQPTTSGTVTLILRSGASSDLDTGATIASSIENSGSYTWQLPSDITRGSDYTIEIVSDSDPTEVNFTPYFVIESTNTVASSTGVVSLGAPTASLPPVSSSTSGSAASSGSTSSGSTSSGSASTTGSSSTGSASSSTTGTASSSTLATTSSAGMTSSSSTAATAQSTGMAGRVQVAGGLLGAVAFGALVI